MFTVHFTALKPLKKYSEKGKLISEETVRLPFSITPVSAKTAELYRGCDDFRLEEIVRVFTKSGPVVKHDGIGNGTRSAAFSNNRAGTTSSAPIEKKSTETALERAAASGDLSAAIS